MTTRDRKWLRQVRRTCKQRQSLFGAGLALTSIFGWWALSNFCGLFEYGLLAMYLICVGFYLILTKRNYSYEMYLEARKVRIKEERMARRKYERLVQSALQ